MNPPAERKIAILDRDGTINRDSPDYIKNVSEWKPLPRSLEAIARLSQAGWTVCIATNQSGIGRGLYTVVDLHAIHATMQAALEELGGQVDGVYFCPHTPDDKCKCRKPEPGLLEEIARRYDISLAGVPVIGDSARDLEAAAAAGARPILVRTGNGKRTLREQDTGKDGEVYDDLAAAVDALLAES